MTFTDIARIRLGEPGELVEVVPYLLGFHPVESLVLLALAAVAGEPPGGRSEVQLACRVDLPDGALNAADLAPLMQAADRSGAQSLVALIFTEPDAPARSAGLLEGAAEAVRGAAVVAGLILLDVLVVDACSWRSLECRIASCCPPGGTPRTHRASRVAAEATFAGLVALPDRSDLAAQLVGLSPLKRDRLLPQIDWAENRITHAALTNCLRRTLARDARALVKAAQNASAQSGSGTGPTARQIARYGVALADIGVRDGLWLAVDDRTLDCGALMLQLLRRLPAPYDAAPLFLFGWQQWREGNGTLSAMAAEQALESNPGYSAARLLLQAVRGGLDPRTTAPLRSPTQ